MKYTFFKATTDNFPITDLGTVVQYNQNVHGNGNEQLSGFQLRPNGISSQQGDFILVLSYEDADIITSTQQNDIVSKVKIEYVTVESDATLLSYLNTETLSSDDAFMWGYVIGNKDIMKNYINESSLVNWVKYVYPEDRERAFALLTNENVLCDWGVELGDRDVIRPSIVSSNCAFAWALNIPEERAAMKPRITEPVWIEAWNIEFPDDKII